ncbi:phage tail protein [Amycolatopsis sp. cmx-11-51]|uniref:phage tail protein n=1 Tax=Amycolatopsis sp. cmx-11-51 TaxID=2785797 RepID=UPI0039E5CEBA
MALTIGELVGYLRIDDKGVAGKLAQARARFAAAARDTDVYDNALVRAGKSARDMALSAGASALKVGALAGAANLAGSALGVLGGGIVTASGALLILPGAAVAGGAALASLKVGLSGFGDALKAIDDPAKFAEATAKLAPAARDTAKAVRALAPAWDAVKRSVQQELFSEMGDVVRQLGAQYLPILKRGMTDVASSFGVGAAGLAAFLREAQTGRDVATIFDNSSTAVANLSETTQPLAQVFRDVATVGSSVFADLTTGAGSAAERFAAFIAAARESEQLETWMRNGLNALQQLGQLAGNVGGIISAVFSAMSTSGVSTLDVLVQATGAVRDFLNSAQGATLLQQVFGGIAAAARGLAPVFAEIGRVLVSDVGPAIATLGPQLGAALASLAPAVAPLGSVLAALAPVVAAVAQSLAGGLASAVTSLEPAVVALAPGLATLASQIGTVLAAALQVAGPLLAMLAGFLSDNMTWLGPLAIGLATVAVAAGPLTTLVGGLSTAFRTATTVFNALRLAMMTNPFFLIATAVALLAVLIISNWDTITSAIGAALDWIGNLISGAVDFMVELFLNWSLPGLIIKHWDTIVAAVETAVNWVLDAVGWFASLPGKVGEWFGRVKDAAIGKALELANWLAGLPGRVLGALGDFGSLLLNAGKDLLSGLWRGIQNAAGWLKDKVLAFFGDLLPGWAKDILGINSPSTVFAGIGKWIPPGLAGGIDKAAGVALRSASDLATRVSDTMAAGLTTPALAFAGTPGTGAAGAAGAYSTTGSRATVHIDQFHATPAQSPADIAGELDWLSRGGG